MGLFSSNKDDRMSGPNWIILKDSSQLTELTNSSSDKPVLFFKHSTRCSISTMAKHRLERKWDLSDEEIIPVYLDLLNYRSLSNELAEKFNVRHESPQVLLVKNGQSIYNASHGEISVDAIKNQL